MAETKKKKGKEPKKVKTKGFPTPVEALDPSDPLGSVIFFGRGFKEDEKDAMLSASVSMSTDQVSQMSFRFIDPGFQRLESGVYDPEHTVVFEDLHLEVGSVDVNSEAGHPAFDVRCRPAIVRALKKRRGTKVLKKASPSDFIKSECKAIGCKYVVQTSPQRKQVARDTKRQKGDIQPPSSWTTFQRLAEETGYAMFEAANTIFFGKPTWLLEQSEKNPMIVDWESKDEYTKPLGIPNCSRNTDTTDDNVSVSLSLPYPYGILFRPGMALQLKGIPTFEDTYLVTSVNINLLSVGQGVEISAGTPVNPMASKGAGGTSGGTSGGGGGRMTSSLRYLLKNKVGFTGDALEKAIAVAMAESGGDSQLYKKDDTTTKWAGYTGLFQIRALKEPGKFEGLDKRRAKFQLLDARYNAEFTYDLTSKGSNWSMFDSFKTGAYKKFYKTGKDYQVAGWETQLPPPPPPVATGSSASTATGGVTSTGTVSTGATGSRSASAFVSVALSQAGDTYIYGAQPSGANPSAFDCSSLVQWAAGRVGVTGVPRTSASQAAYCRSRGISIDQAVHTRGALLFAQTSSIHHVAISLGNGSTIEAAAPGYGVCSLSATSRSFSWTSAGLIPGMNY